MKNEFGIKNERVKDGVRYITIDTAKATLMRLKWVDLGDWGKKKFENHIFLTKMDTGKEKMKFIYA